MLRSVSIQTLRADCGCAKRPGYYSDRKPAFTKQEVTVRKNGCEEQRYTFRRNERPDLGAIVSAYYLALPILWVTQYKGHHAYEFECLQATNY